MKRWFLVNHGPLVGWWAGGLATSSCLLLLSIHNSTGPSCGVMDIRKLDWSSGGTILGVSMEHGIGVYKGVKVARLAMAMSTGKQQAAHSMDGGSELVSQLRSTS